MVKFDYQKIFGILPVAVFIADTKTGKIIECNKAAEKLLKRPKEEIIGLHQSKLYPEEEAGKYKELFTEHIKKKKAASFEAKIQRKDGTTVPVIIETKSFKTGSKEVIAGLFIDISELEKTEEALKESEHRYEGIFNISPEAIAIIDIKGNFTDANEQMAKLTGYKREEFIGKNLKDLPFLDEENKKKAGDAFGRRINGEKLPPYEIVFIKKGGEKRIGRISATLIKSHNNKVTGEISIISDITEIRKAEEQMELESQLLDAATDSMFLHDFEGKFLYVNKAACISHGYIKEEFLKLNLKELDVPEFADLIKQRMDELIRRGSAVFESAHFRKDGSMLPVEVHAKIIESGGRKLVLSAARDITERKRSDRELQKYRDHLEELVKERTLKLEETNEKLETEIIGRRHTEEKLKETMRNLVSINSELEQFAYIVSHDLQEPLSVVLSSLELIIRECEGDMNYEVEDCIYRSIDSIMYMTKLINDLLMYSRLTSKSRALDTVDLEGIMKRVLLNLKNKIEESRAVVTCDPMPRVKGDNMQLIQLFQNLISNAIKFRGREPLKIHISARKNEDGWLFSVKDNGIGMEIKDIESIFTVFKRLHLKDKYPGTGIGLAVCKKIVERHNGRIWVESEPDKGTTFYFTIPASDS
ncbi:MAG: PAS domain S-box protein [Armatimonadota bacterium]